jgi:hypothetical protein
MEEPSKEKDPVNPKTPALSTNIVTRSKTQKISEESEIQVEILPKKLGRRTNKDT